MRQILLITAAGLRVWHLDRGRLEMAGFFPADAAGQAGFADYLDGVGALDTQVFTDLVEEDFRIEPVAHASGRDRQALLARHGARLFRSTPYRRAEVLGRKADDRRRDEVLFSALTNPEVIDVWLEPLRQRQVPVAGLCSVALLTPSLVTRLRDRKAELLVVSEGCDSGLRQSFVVGGRLRFSRLTPVPSGLTPEAYADFVHAEIGKTKRYLSNLHLLARDRTLETAMPSAGERLAALQAMGQERGLDHYEFLDMNEAAARIGYRGQPLDACADGLFAALLASRPRADHYTLVEDRKRRWRHRAERAAPAVAATALVAAVFWAGLNLFDGLALQAERAATEQRIALAEQHLETVRAALPETEFDPHLMRAAVALAGRLYQERQDPHRALATLGQRLMAHGGLAPRALDWFVSENPDAKTPEFADERLQDAMPELGLDDEPIEAEPGTRRRYAISRLEGEVEPFDGNFTRAHQRVQALVEDLGRRPGVFRAAADQLPLNTASDARVAGSLAGEEAVRRARFAVRLVLEGQG